VMVEVGQTHVREADHALTAQRPVNKTEELHRDASQFGLRVGLDLTELLNGG
jgi:hypothetical protein